MKTNSLCRQLAITLAAGGLALGAAAAEPKKVLVVSVTAGFRHSSISVAEQTITEIGAASGAFTVVDYARQPAQKPNPPQKPKEPAADANDQAKTKYQADVSTCL